MDQVDYLVQIIQNWPKLDQLGSNQFNLVQIGKIGSNWIKIDQDKSDQFKSDRIEPNWI